MSENPNNPNNRRNERNDVKGPTSALTSFLREKGIRPRNLNPYARRITTENQAQPANAPNTSAPETTETETSSSSLSNTATSLSSSITESHASNSVSTVSTTAAAAGIQETTAPAKGRKRNTKSKAETANDAEKKQPGKRKRTTKKKQGDDADSDTGSDPFEFPDPLTASRKGTSSQQRSREKHDYISVRVCLSCKRRYHGTVLSTLCPACSMIKGPSGNNDGAAKKTKKKRRKAEDIILEMDDEKRGGVVTLKELCVQLVCNNIELVDAFGDIPLPLKIRISKIISKMRLLDSRTVQLFLGPTESELHLFDCTKLDSDALPVIPAMCPNLTTLYLAYCGRMNDEALTEFYRCLPNLTNVTLKGPFLVTNNAWMESFKNWKNLRSICLENAAKLVTSGVQSLVENCKQLQSVGLRHCHSIGDEAVEQLNKLEKLQAIDLSGSGEGRSMTVKDSTIVISNTSLTNLIEKHHQHLQSICLNELIYVTEDILKPIAKCSKLKRLEVGYIPLTPESLTTFSDTCHTTMTLHHVSLRRCMHIDDTSLIALLNRHTELESLDLNGCDLLTPKSLICLATDKTDNIQTLDLSFVRALDDVLLGKIITGDMKFGEFDPNAHVSTSMEVDEVTHIPKVNWSPNRKLEKVWVFGCHLISNYAVERSWIRPASNAALDTEVRVVGSEFD